MKKIINQMKRVNNTTSDSSNLKASLMNNNNNKYEDEHFNHAGELFQSSMLQIMTAKREELNASEKNYLIAAERGDLSTVKSYLEQASLSSEKINISCIDPLGRSALLIAIEYENLEMIELLLNHHVQIGEALLHAINEEFVEAVEILLQYQDQDAINSMEKAMNSKKQSDSETSASINKPSTSADVLTQNQSSRSFTPDITPIILAAHKDNYEIIKILLDRGERIPEPHDVRCNCSDCINARKEDSLRYSRSRINAFRALASPSLISLSNKDPILKAFELSWELRRLSKIENEFKDDYEKLSLACQEYASALLAETRTSKELEIVLNYDHENLPNPVDNEEKSLSRLKLAIKFKQKKFVAHSHCQQLLVSFWYEGLPSFRRRNLFIKILSIILISLSFPVLSVLYILMPNHRFGRALKQPFVKFICHSASYVLFLFLLILASQRFHLSNDSADDAPQLTKSSREKRGSLPTTIETIILVYVLSFVWTEVKQLYSEGVHDYLSNWWNLLDFITNSLYVITVALRLAAFIIVQREIVDSKEEADYSREKWDPWDPTLISESLFAIANIFSTLKLVYIFTIHPNLGPLQISIGKMVFDIFKFATFILLVMFSFGCGLNQLYWYYAHMKEQECDKQAASDKEECYLKIKYFSNLFETLQTLYWGVFGLVEKDRLELHRRHVFTMFIGLTMFGTYCAIMIIILINMLIAMMNNSYQRIANQADEEWKFARAKLWLSYFEGGCTLPIPFSLIPTPKSFFYVLRWIYRKFCYFHRQSKREEQRWDSVRKMMKKISEREYKYQAVVKELVKRYIMKQQKRDRNSGVTEDDLNEIKQDISGLRFELLDIFKHNGYKIDSLKQNFANKIGRRRAKMNLEKAIKKNFFESTNIFDALINAKTEASENHNSPNVKSIKFLSPAGSFKKHSENKSDSVVKNIKETQSPSSTKKMKNNEASIFKLANKIKKIKEKNKKLTVTATIATIETDPIDNTKAETTKLLIEPQKQEMAVNRDNITIVLNNGEETFTERITEV